MNPNATATRSVAPSGLPPAHFLRWSWVSAGIIVLLVLAVYWPVLRGGFVWDDTLLVERNPLVTGEANLRSLWLAADFPLTTVALWLQWLLWGKHATGYHVVNVLLHAGGSVLLWRVLARLGIPGAWLGALLFALHPVGVASAGWISEQKNTLSLLFYLVSLWCYLRFAENEPPKSETTGLTSSNPEDATEPSRATPGPESQAGLTSIPGGNGKTGRWWYWLSLLAFMLALLSKTSTVMLPVILLACSWWRTGRITRRDIWRTAPFFALGLAFGLMTLWFQAHQVHANVEVQSENFLGRLAGAGMAVWFYLGKTFLPLNLSMIYPRWEIDAQSAVSYLPVLLLAGAVAVGWWFRRGWGRHVLFALACFIASLFPVLGCFDMYFLVNSRVSDHFQYLALIPALALVAAMLAIRLNATARRVIGTALALGLLLLTLQRARVFASDEALWRDTLAKNPAAWMAHNNLACILAEQQKLDDAIRHFEASLNINPRNPSAQGNLGRALLLTGRPVDAETRFLAALELKPDDAATLTAYAQLLAGSGRKEEALSLLQKAVSARPKAETRLQLAQMLATTGRRREAVAEYRRVLALRPESVEALNNLAWMLATCWDGSVRNGDEAVRLAEQACRLTGNQDPRMLGALAAAYAEAGRFGDAVSAAQNAIHRATAAGNAQFAAINQQLLQLYLAGRPYHEPPPKPAAPPGP